LIQCSGWFPGFFRRLEFFAGDAPGRRNTWKMEEFMNNRMGLEKTSK
jgi:hypothetical protein